MFSFLRRSKAKRDNDCTKEIAEDPLVPPLVKNRYTTPRAGERSPESTRNGCQPQTTKDVINLLIPESSLDYGNQNSGVGAFFQRMAGGRRRNKHRKNTWINNYNKHHAPVKIDRQKNQVSVKENSEEEFSLDDPLRNDSNEDDAAHIVEDHTPTRGERVTSAQAVGDTQTVDARAQADFVRDLVLEKYTRATNKSDETSNENIHASDRLKQLETQFDNKDHLLLQSLLANCEDQLVQIVKTLENSSEKNINNSECVVNNSHEQLKDVKSDEDHEISANWDDILLQDDKKIENFKEKIKINRECVSFDQEKHKEGNHFYQISDKGDCNNICNNSVEVMGAAESRNNHQSIDLKKSAVATVPDIILELENNEDEEIFTDESEDEEKDNGRSAPIPIKSNLKLPKNDNYPSDDDSSVRSNDSNKKKVTFKKTIDFDDGDTQTDDEMDSTFESLSSESSSDEDSSDGPDNDENLGGDIVIINRTDVNVDKPSDIINNINSDYIDSDISAAKVVDDIPTILADFDSLNVDDDECDTVKNDSNDLAFEVESFSGSSSDDSSNDDEEGGDDDAEINPDIITRNLVNQEGRFQEQVSQLTELAAARSSDADSLRWKLEEVKRELEVKDAGAERLRAELSSAHKEAELVRQRLKFLEEELSATRCRSADLAEQLATFESSKMGAPILELDSLKQRIRVLEERLAQLESEKKSLLEEKKQQEKRAEEAIAAVEACETRWRRAHEMARTEASERAERVLADCEWKMRELERKARDADKKLTELTQKYENQPQPTNTTSNTNSVHVAAELSQLRGLSHEQQRALRAAGTKAAAAEQREAALAQDLMRLRELIDRDRAKASEVENKYKEQLSCQEERIRSRLEEQRRAIMTLNQNSVRLEVEKVKTQLEKDHIEKQRTALQQQRAEHERAIKCVERRLKEAQTRLENLKDVLAKKESQFEQEIAEVKSSADWDMLQLRHLLDRADIKYATALDELQNRHELQIERLNQDWNAKLQEAENASVVAAGQARENLERMKREMLAEKQDQINRIKEQHKREMEQQFEDFMTDKEYCLDRMKNECRLEGEEDRVQRERDLSDEIKEMKAEVVSKTNLISTLKEQLISKERRFNVTDEELRDALRREELLRLQYTDLAERSAISEQESKSNIDHLTRKCACLTKLFEEMRSRLEARDAVAAEERRSRQEDLDALKAEISRLTARLAECGSPGDRTSADGCDSIENKETEIPQILMDFFHGAAPHHSKDISSEPRRKGGGKYVRRRAKSVDLPAVQVPVRVRQFDSGRNYPK